MDDLRELDSAATPAPWYYDPTQHNARPYWFDSIMLTPQALINKDAALIVALRNSFASGDLIPRSEHERELAEKDAVIATCVEALTVIAAPYDGDFPARGYEAVARNTLRAIQATKEGEGE